MKQKPLFLVKTIFFFLTTLLMFMGSSSAYAGSALYPIRNGYIVVFKDNIENTPAVVAEINQRYKIKNGCIYQHCLKGFSAIIPTSAIARIKNDPRVKYIEPDHLAYALFQTLPAGVGRIKADLNPIARINGKDERVNVDVAIIDTGIDLTHPDLNVIRNKSFVPRTSSGNDDNGHGTHVAGIVAAIDNGFGVVGIAPGARLYAVKVLDRRGSGKISWIIAGIDWITAHADKIEVANLSLGSTGYSQSLRDAITNSVNKGVVYVVAAGNEQEDVYGQDGILGTDDDHVPGAYPEVATISAMVDFDGRSGGLGGAGGSEEDDALATFSNFSASVVDNNPVISPGAAIDFAAPGVDIYSTYKNGGYKTLSGTSMSSPHGTGCVALYIAGHGRAHNAAEVAAIRQALIDRAEPQSHWGAADTKDPDSNREGLVDAEALDSPSIPEPLDLISIHPNSVSIPKGTTQAFTAVGQYADGSVRDITNTVIWASSDTTVATIDPSGLATGITEGIAYISATFNNVNSKTAVLMVTAPALESIFITPSNNSILVGGTGQYTATGVYADSSTKDITTSVIWVSSNNSVATIDSNGLATGLGTGTTYLTARSGQTISQQVELKVYRTRLRILLSNIFLNRDKRGNFTAACPVCPGLRK